MNSEALFREGKLNEAIAALASELRDKPADIKKRTFLFELLCFSGDYDRAEKHLDLLCEQSRDAMLGTLLYRGAIAAERIRHRMFATNDLPQTGSNTAVRGTLNGKPFSSIADADPRIGSKLEIFAGGDYLWIDFENIAILEMEAPKRLRDTLWAPAKLKTGPAFRDKDLGEVLIPALAPESAFQDDAQIQLGRVTEWFRDENGNEFPLGQKVLLIDGEETPLLSIRKLEIASAEMSEANAEAAQT